VMFDSSGYFWLSGQIRLRKHWRAPCRPMHDFKNGVQR
jgi:hypothetical protein